MNGHSDVTLTLQRRQLELREGAAGTADAASPAARCLLSGCLSLPRALQDQDPQRGQARPEGPVSSWGLWAHRVGEFPCTQLPADAGLGELLQRARRCSKCLSPKAESWAPGHLVPACPCSDQLGAPVSFSSAGVLVGRTGRGRGLLCGPGSEVSGEK